MSWASQFIRSQMLADDFRHALTIIEKEHPTANKQGKSECCRSGVCCWRRPGALSKDDLSRMAGHFGMSEKEVFQKYLAVDEIKGIRTVVPIRKHQTSYAGKMISWEETFSLESPCVFLGEGNACEVHEAKPLNCSSYKCWEKNEEPFQLPAWSVEELTELGWDGNNPDDYYD